LPKSSHSLPPGPHTRELDTASALAREAGALILGYRDCNLRVELKDGDEPVTIADRNSSDLIVRGLSDAFPQDVIISEENADDLRRLQARRVWYIDPIDGTKDFIRGEDGFCVMIGLTLDHRPVAGVIFAPASERLFYAARGAGAWIVAPGEEARRIAVSEVSDLAQVRLVASKSHRDQTIDQVKSALGIANELNVGSVGLKLGLIAVGERDLYVNPSSHCSSWDTCAPEAILTEAGGELTDIHGDLLRYDAPKTGHPEGLLASNRRIHAAAVARLSPLFSRS
jgi:3'(2'), 5'-bisphosphate nucleotidase